jgi:hypothetical protein
MWTRECNYVHGEVNFMDISSLSVFSCFPPISNFFRVCRELELFMYWTRVKSTWET